MSEIDDQVEEQLGGDLDMAMAIGTALFVRMSTSRLTNAMAVMMANLRDALVRQDFTREEAMAIVTHSAGQMLNQKK